MERNGEFYLRDTYWNDDNSGKKFTLDEALRQGELKFKCNLDDIIGISESDKS